jgi:hypothetical protein
VVFEDEFLQKTQFISWKDGKIIVGNSPTDEVKKRIAGEIIKTINALKTTSVIFYVEDEMQQKVVDLLAKYIKKDVIISIAGNKPNVINLCRYFSGQDTNNVFFLVDGDNENIPDEFSKNNQFIQLKKYCIENYFLDPQILSAISGKKLALINKFIRDSIIESSSNQHTLIYKKLAQKGNVEAEVLDTLETKNVLTKVVGKLKLGNKYEFVEKYIKMCFDKNKAEAIFGDIIKKIKQDSTK